VVSDTFEPGSTFKLVTASAALEDKKVEPTTSFFCPGKVVLWDIPIRCTSVHNDVTLEQVIERSCNSGIIKVGELLGPKNLYYYIRKFGFAEKTGVDLHSEVEGQVRPPERWSGLSVGAISMGQELSVTGMQMLSAISAIANGGLLVRPRIIKKVVDSETGAVIAEPALDVRHRVISQKTAEQVTKAMIMVTHSGSGTYAALDDYMIAGKTGTSEKLGRGKAEGNMRYVASFIGFLPAKEPKVVIYVVLNEPKGEKVRGGTMAAPVFREIARQVMLLKKVPPEVGAGTPVARISPEQEEHPLEEGPAATASAKPVPPSPNHADKAEQDEGEAPGDDPDDAGNDRDADRE
jgi:cell division protein FtsI (penicillin-binding protein 3)